jgi:hypothetical protein
MKINKKWCTSFRVMKNVVTEKKLYRCSAFTYYDLLSKSITIVLVLNMLNKSRIEIFGLFACIRSNLTCTIDQQIKDADKTCYALDLSCDKMTIKVRSKTLVDYQ